MGKSFCPRRPSGRFFVSLPVAGSHRAAHVFPCRLVTPVPRTLRIAAATTAPCTHGSSEGGEGKKAAEDPQSKQPSEGLSPRSKEDENGRDPGVESEKTENDDDAAAASQAGLKRSLTPEADEGDGATHLTPPPAPKAARLENEPRTSNPMDRNDTLLIFLPKSLASSSASPVDCDPPLQLETKQCRMLTVPQLLQEREYQKSLNVVLCKRLSLFDRIYQNKRIVTREVPW
ncbi:uncharacterized protein [Panulirus ornatus]|uniref:uncharacterized protein n=1 Tax=Panulirus ornatus TaxID=150431 RepID=UPI003A8B8534